MKTLDEKELFALIESELDSSEDFSDDSDDLERVIFSSEEEESINISLDLKMISIRLQKNLINDLKAVAQLNGIGYQPLIKQILTRFIVSEKKKMHNDKLALELKAKMKEVEDKLEEINRSEDLSVRTAMQA